MILFVKVKVAFCQSGFLSKWLFVKVAFCQSGFLCCEAKEILFCKVHLFINVKPYRCIRTYDVQYANLQVLTIVALFAGGLETALPGFPRIAESETCSHFAVGMGYLLTAWL